MSHAKPRAPVIRNAHRHPRCPAIHGTKSGVTIAPTLVPALNNPVASALSFLGNHSATHLMLAGNTPASPNPNIARAIANAKKELAAACAIDARLQKTIDTAYPMRVPKRSVSRPTQSIPNAYG